MIVFRTALWTAAALAALLAVGFAWRGWWFLVLWPAAGAAFALFLLHTIFRSRP